MAKQRKIESAELAPIVHTPTVCVEIQDSLAAPTATLCAAGDKGMNLKVKARDSKGDVISGEFVPLNAAVFVTLRGAYGPEIGQAIQDAAVSATPQTIGSILLSAPAIADPAIKVAAKVAIAKVVEAIAIRVADQTAAQRAIAQTARQAYMLELRGKVESARQLDRAAEIATAQRLTWTSHGEARYRAAHAAVTHDARHADNAIKLFEN